MIETGIKVKTDHYDGPLGLLLHLIEKEEMSIDKLDLTVITTQYLEFLAQWERELDFDLAGEYLRMAATLIYLKSSYCLAEDEVSILEEMGEEVEITSQAELIRRLEELSHFQKIGERLWKLPKLGHEIFVKPKVNKKAISNSILTQMELDKLTMAMIEFIQKNRRSFSVVERERISIKDKLIFLKSFLKMGTPSDLDEILMAGKDDDDQSQGKSLSNIVVSFISLLELARLKKIRVFQNENYSKIHVEVIEPLDNFDVSLADGFENETANESSDDKEMEFEPANSQTQIPESQLLQ